MPTNRVVGLDIGTSSLKAAQVRRDGDTFIVESTHTRPLPAQLIKDGRVVEEKQDALVTEIADFFKQAGFQTRDVIVGLSNPADAITRSADFNWVAPKDLEEALPLMVEAQRSIVNVDPEDFDFAVTPISEYVVGRQKKLRTLVYAARIEATEKLAEVVKAAGLQLVGIDLTSLAGLRAMAVPFIDASVVHVIVNVGHSLTSVVIHRGGVPLQISVVEGLGGNEATERVAEALATDNKFEAEAKKFEARAKDGDVFAAIDGANRALANNIRGTVDEFFSKNRNVEDALGGITLLGGGALLHNLPATLSRTFDDIEVQHTAYDPRFKAAKGNVIDRFDAEGRDLAVAIGLAAGARVA
ncbi:pilus assembly protein PilM (plasmid) [Frondihabitans sucicola]|uniref:Pilus assembly protein PilM n=1 Tax=Frondihabitans sucicola TaxID=1268041 RepID=A0ABN6Y634_9MICO|nr:pilus assembly protein PilM [Frondihabitans sucicola]BDZ52491.1 pilus assembly protein PilM [Frondihabitans sucicola]